MGRFETTASTYALYREPYPPSFFKALADRLDLRGTEALIDLGTGPGVLALGMAPYVGSILGVDPEAAMLAAARAEAETAGVALPLLAGRAEDLPADTGPFDLVTIGRALHWMDRTATIAVLDRILATDGTILVCGSRPEKDGSNPWQEALEGVMHRWAPTEAAGWSSVYGGWFDGTPFVAAGAVETVFTQPVSPETLFRRMLTRSSTSAAMLGDRVEDFRAELMTALAPHFPDGVRNEVLKARADMYRRS